MTDIRSLVGTIDVFGFVGEWADPWDGLIHREVYELVDIEARAVYTVTLTNSGCTPCVDS